LDVTIPFNVTAEISMPNLGKREVGSGTYKSTCVMEQGN